METETIPIWQNKPHGSTRSVVRMIGTSLPLKPCRRVCFELVPGLSAVDSLHSVYGTGPPVPTLADVAWIAADEGEAFTRLRADVRPFREEWHPTPLLIMHRNSSVPNFRREGRRHETLKKPGLAALNRTVALQDELSRLREQIAKIVAVQESDEDATESAAFTPELGSPDTTSIACSLPEFESVYPSLASFTINDITETDEPDCMSLSSFSIAGTSNFDFEKKDLKDDDDDDGEVVSLSKSTSFADMMDILKDMNRVKLHSLQGSKGDSLRENDPAVRISEALKRKFTVQDNGIFLNEN
ncbi:mitochondrial fission regulator 1-like [Callorhinchus milii]|uniref:Mitochondrial fission regulator n=1 Tax=Callorhinchus milii TaxID=7868 RepID=V9KH01_CALMI|nr:mitochondrial fission regulator 1-like [Callorhinchus milii]XP_007892989.2 mitochondrial fission regulator 1-like [Callorhinchus milii]